MSVMACNDCGAFIDTDKPEDCEWIEIGNMRRHVHEIMVCINCYETRVEERERWNTQEAQAMEEAEREGT